MESAQDQRGKKTTRERAAEHQQAEEQQSAEALSAHPLEQIDMNEHDEGTEELADQRPPTSGTDAEE